MSSKNSKSKSKGLFVYNPATKEGALVQLPEGWQQAGDLICLADGQVVIEVEKKDE